MKLHVYCLIEPVETLLTSLHGIGGVLVRRLDTGDFLFLVSDFPDRSVPVTRENALAHAAVIRSVLKQTTPLPFRFGTLVTEQQLENYVAAKREALRSRLEEVRGCVEMNVKIISDRDPAEVSPAVGTQETPGTAFLADKRREILASEARVAEAKRVAEWLEGQTAGIVKKTDIKTTPADRFGSRTANKLLVGAAYLVERERVDEFRITVAEARQQRPDLHFLVSGPWAPYSFANMDLEFETHFGVS